METSIIIILLIVGAFIFLKSDKTGDKKDTDWNIDDFIINDEQENDTPVKKEEDTTDRLLSLQEIKDLSTTEVLARTLYGEGRGEDNSELYKIGEVILNRRKDYHFPFSIKEVCLEKWQFSCWNSLYKDILKNNHKVVRQVNINTNRFTEIKNIARDIITNSFPKKLPKDTLYYFIPASSDIINNGILVSSEQNWKEGLKVVYKGDKHYFFKEYL